MGDTWQILGSLNGRSQIGISVLGVCSSCWLLNYRRSKWWLSLLIGLFYCRLMLSRAASHTWLLAIYFVVSLGCYGVLMVGVGLMQFSTCPQEDVLFQQDIGEAKGYLKQRGVDVSPDR